MKKTKKNLSIFLALIMIISIIPISTIKVSAETTLVWPVPGHKTLSWGYNSDHAGIDISDSSIAGANVVAAMSGTVCNIYLCTEQHLGDLHTCSGFGTGVIILGDDGRWYQYAHMQANSIPANVYYGAYVTAGTKIGQVGTTGNSSGNHLHFQINTTSAFKGHINPQNESYTDNLYYTVSYNANGGTGAPASQTKTHGLALTLSSAIPTRTGYTFLGWSTSSTATTVSYTAGSNFYTDANTTLYAVWRADEISGLCGDNVTWHLNVATGVMTIFGNGAMNDYDYSSQQPWYNYNAQIKKVVVSNGITSVGDYAFYGCTNITDIKIGESVTRIGHNAFSYCSSLSNISLSDNITSIIYTSFSNTAYYNDEKNWENGVMYIGKYLIRCNPDVVTGEYSIKDGTKVIANNAFWGCRNITDINIPDSVVIIGASAFGLCKNITNIEIPKSVVSVVNSSFMECDNLTNITVDKDNLYYSSDEYGVLFNKDKTEIIKYPQGNTRTSYSIPYSVTKIGEASFSYCRYLVNIKIPDDVVIIDTNAFSFCSKLTNVTIPNNVTFIGHSAFYFCGNLTSMIIPDDITEIDTDTFAYCSNLTSITLPCGITSIGSGAFTDCSNLTDVYYIGTEEQWEIIDVASSFHGYSNEALIDANIHYCEEIIGKSATCKECGYTDGLYCNDCEDYVKGHEIIPSLDHKYEAITTPPTCIDVGYTTFSCDCGDRFTSNIVSATGHSYKNGICINCGDSEKVESLTSGVCGDNLTWNFDDSTGTLTISGSGGMYDYSIDETAPWIYDYSNDIKYLVIEDGVTLIGDYAFHGCSELRNVTIPASVTRIGDCAFERCIKLNCVYYSGTPGQWNNIVVGSNNACLTDQPREHIAYTFNIQTPSTTTIRSKDGIILHPNVGGAVPDGWHIEWTASNDNFDMSVRDDGSLEIISNKNGYTTFTAHLYDSYGAYCGFDQIEMRSKAGFFDKIGSFFRSLFGSTKIYEY